MKKVALILSGCGHKDGAEIRESLFTLLALDKYDAKASVFAPNIEQADVINHLTGEKMNESRNVLIEASRIARGDIRVLDELNPNDFDALILPGGFGAAKNLSNIAFKGGEGEVIEPVKKVIRQFIASKKPVGAICISPAIVASALKSIVKPTLTLGDENDLLKAFDADQKLCKANEIVIDQAHKIVTTPAYMLEDRIKNIAEGIEKMVLKILELAQ